MRTVIYARYSPGSRQTEQSIEGQIRVCTEYCKAKGLEIVGEYCDRHITGKTDDRPEFQKLIADAKHKKFEAVVVYRTDRFSRNKYDSAIYKRELKKNGVQIYYAAEAIPEGPEGIILESLMEGLAEYYSVELAQKVRRGMRESALKCKCTGGGRALGYICGSDKTFQIDPNTAPAVQAIFDMYIKGTTNAAICEYLNAHGFKTTRGGQFNKNSINRIIKNRKYIGEYKYDDIILPGGVPALITPEVFNLAQREMARRKTVKKPKGPKAEYLLSGKAFCGHCKAPMQGVSSTSHTGRIFNYYACANTRGKNRTCKKKTVGREFLENLIVKLTKEYILKEGILQEIAEKVYAAQQRQSNTASELAFYEKKLAENKRATENILRSIESGVVTKTLPERLKKLEDEQVVIEGELEFLRNKKFEFSVDEIAFMLMNYLHPFEGEDEQAYNKRIITCFVAEVYVYDDRLIIFFNISSPDGKLQSIDVENLEKDDFSGATCDTLGPPKAPQVAPEKGATCDLFGGARGFKVEHFASVAPALQIVHKVVIYAVLIAREVTNRAEVVVVQVNF